MKFTPAKLFWGSHCLMLMGIALWLSPITHPLCKIIDEGIFFLLNGSLKNQPFWQFFWGMLNHRRETLLNLLAAACISIWAVLSTKDPFLRSRCIRQSFYFWVCFEIGFQLQDMVFYHLLELRRLSPSMVLEPVVKLSLLLDNTRIIDFSKNSFPSGHAFAMIYWGSFTYLIAPKLIARIALVFAIFFCIPRLFSGAHWFSDELFSAILALMWLSWTMNLSLYKKWIS